MELAEIIRRYRKAHGLSQRAFAARCDGITNGYIAIIESGKNPNTGKPSMPSIEKLTAIAKGMGMTFDQLRRMMSDKPAQSLFIGKVEPTPFDTAVTAAVERAIKNAIPYTPARSMVPIIGTVRCGPGGLAYQDIQGTEPADVADASEYFWLRAEGDSMAPEIREGDLVLVHIQPEVDSGALAVVIVDGEEGMLKKYVRKDNAVILMSLNQEYPPRVFVGEEMNLVKVAGKVVESKRKY